MGKGFLVQNFPTNYLFIVGVVNQSMKKKQCEDAPQKAKNKINLIASWGPFLRKRFGGPGEVSPVSPPLGGPGGGTLAEKEGRKCTLKSD